MPFHKIKLNVCKIIINLWAKSGTELFGVYFPSWLPRPTALVMVFVFPNFCTILGCGEMDYDTREASIKIKIFRCLICFNDSWPGLLLENMRQCIKLFRESLMEKWRTWIVFSWKIYFENILWEIFTNKKLLRITTTTLWNQ